MREEGSDSRVLQPQHAHIRSHSHLAQAIRVEIELVVYPVSEVLCERVFVSRGRACTGRPGRRTLSIAWNFFRALPSSFRRMKLERSGRVSERDQVTQRTRQR